MASEKPKVETVDLEDPYALAALTVKWGYRADEIRDAAGKVGNVAKDVLKELKK